MYFFTVRLRIVLVFGILTIARPISESPPANTQVTMEILQKYMATFS